MNFDELMRTRPWLTTTVHLPNHPVGMLGMYEAQLYYYLAKDAFSGSGTIVDAGSFLGKSANYLAQGLRVNPKYKADRHRIHCFDNFLVNESATVGFIGKYLHQTLAIGDSTRELFDAQVEPVRDMLEVHAGDFNSLSWQPEPIEILMVDIAKTERLNQRVAEVLFSCLIPGVSLVIHQDYHHPWLPHIHVAMEYLADYFESVVPRVDDSAAFRHTKAIPASVLKRVIDYDFSDQEKLELMDGAIARLPEGDRYYVQLARIVLQFHKTDEITLSDELDQLQSQFEKDGKDYSANMYFDAVRDSLNEMKGWRYLAEGSFERCLQVTEEIIKQRPTTHNLTMRGSALIGLERYGEAEKQLRAALELHPPAGYAYVHLARALMHQDRLAEAETELLRGVRDNHGEASSAFLNWLNAVWLRENPLQDKTEIMTMLHRDLPEDPEVWVLDARLHHITGDHGGVAGSLAKASRLGLSPERLTEVRHEMQLPA